MATFLILGPVCTRGCAFCAVRGGRPPAPPAEDEPRRLARGVARLGLRHAVVTSVTRDDLPDGGAAHFGRVAGALRGEGAAVELLVPDFGGRPEALEVVLAAGPEVLAHNIETVPRLYGRMRAGADYGRSLALLRRAKETGPGTVTKSGLILGLGERPREVEATLADLRSAGCDMLTLGQYLAPTRRHAPVARYVEPEEFAAWRTLALGLGFRSVAAAPLVRSSYLAPAFLAQARPVSRP